MRLDEKVILERMRKDVSTLRRLEEHAPISIISTYRARIQVYEGILRGDYSVKQKY